MGQADAPSWLVIPLAVGTGLAVSLAVTGVVVTKRSAGALPAVSDPAVRRRYGIVVGLEFGLLGAGAGRKIVHRPSPNRKPTNDARH